MSPGILKTYIKRASLFGAISEKIEKKKKKSFLFVTIKWTDFVSLLYLFGLYMKGIKE